MKAKKADEGEKKAKDVKWNYWDLRKFESREKLKDGLLFGVQGLGNGSVILLSDDLLFRNFWENGKLMFCNAVFLTGVN